MRVEIILGIILPFLGTTIGSSLVFLMKDKMNSKIQKILLGFAAGVMIAASIWSLITPSINLSEHLGDFSFVPAAVGFLLGVGFLLVLDSVIPHMHLNSDKPEGVKSNFKKSTMLVFAVALHNIPEGMAVGVVLAGAIYGDTVLTLAGALSLAIGIAIQNLPEGAIISMPLKEEGESKGKSFLLGVLSGILEPIAAIVTILLVQYVTPILPYILSFAAGAMIYVVVEELIPEAQDGEHSNIATIALALGFVLMMILDIALG
jgi:ZIP family zinc transporter